MALQPGIILGGQQLDVLGAMDAGRKMAESQIAMNRQNALAELYRTQGAQIAAGDQNALNALASFDPMASLGVQDARLGMDQTRLGMEATRLGMDQTRQQMAALDAETKRKAEEYARGLSKEQAAAEAAEIEGAVKQAMMAPDAATFDALMTQMGRPEMVGQFENREMLAAQFMSVADILKMADGPEWRSATPEEAAAYGAASGQINTKTGQFQKTGDGNGISYTTTNADGSTTTVQVGGSGKGGGKPLTEAQSKDNVYATRARGALTKLETPVDPNTPGAGTYADTLTSRAGKIGDALNALSMGYSREVLQTPEFQTATTAGKEFVYAILRKDTGAAITAPEELMYFDVYLPQPGDLPERKAYKAEARARAVAAIEAGMNAQQLNAVTSALNAGDVETADRLIEEARGAQGGGAPAAQPGGEAKPKRLKFNPATGELE